MANRATMYTCEKFNLQKYIFLYTPLQEIAASLHSRNQARAPVHTDLKLLFLCSLNALPCQPSGNPTSYWPGFFLPADLALHVPPVANLGLCIDQVSPGTPSSAHFKSFHNCTLKVSVIPTSFTSACATLFYLHSWSSWPSWAPYPSTAQHLFNAP